MASDLFREELKEELPKWTKKKLVSPINAKKISNLYKEKSVKTESWTQEKLIKTLVIIASIVIGIGVLLYVASNWDKMSDLLKTIILGVATFGTLYVGYFFRESNLGKSLLFLSTIIYGATVFLISQIYNISGVSTSTLFFIWFLGTVLIAYFFDSYSSLLLSSIILAIWNGVAAAHNKVVIIGYPIIFFGMLYLADKKLNKLKVLNKILHIIIGAIALLTVFEAVNSYYAFGAWFIACLIYAFFDKSFLGLTTAIISTFFLHFSLVDHLNFVYAPLLFFVIIALNYYHKQKLITIFSVVLLGLSSLTIIEENFWPTLIISLALLVYYIIELNIKKVSNITRNITLAVIPVTALAFAISFMDTFEVLDFSFPIIMIILLLFTYKERSWIPLVSNIILTFIWSLVFALSAEEFLGINMGLNSASTLFYALGFSLLLTSLAIVDKKFRKPYLIGLPVFLITNFILTFNDVTKNLIIEGFFNYLMFVLLGLTILVSFFGLKEKKTYKISSILLIIISLLFVFILFQPITAIFIMNLVFFGVLLFFIYASFINKNTTIFNLSLLALAIYLVIRYFDLAWKLFDRSLFFIITGIILLVGALILEKIRKLAIKGMTKKGMIKKDMTK